MKNLLLKCKDKKVKAFTLLEIKDSKFLYIFHLIITLSAVT
ncbi:competence protein [Streptococcus agalactiae]|nr:competence protein [Streptococcus agalactiae]CNE58608.1 competence protein [Streptococcus agalactiae]CNJ90394.1 competence protein [Streptococcus agalactiae]